MLYLRATMIYVYLVTLINGTSKTSSNNPLINTLYAPLLHPYMKEINHC